MIFTHSIILEKADKKESDNFDENEEAKRITYFSIMNNKRVIFAFIASIVAM